MKYRFILVLTILLFILSSCASLPGLNSGGSGGGPDIREPTTGRGLELNFRIDTRWISLKEVGYRLEVRNSGRDPIILRPENVRLRTSEVLQDGSSAITQDSLQEIYSQLFSQSGELILNNGQNKVVTGVITIDDRYFDDLNRQSFTYVLSVEYDYRTSFSNNVVVDMENRRVSVDRISQAAPVQMTRIELEPRQGGRYVLTYHIEDRGDSSNLRGKRVEITNREINFGSNRLSCDPYRLENDNRRELLTSGAILTDNSNRILLVCDFNPSDYERQDGLVNSQTFGSFEYRYTVERSGTVSLPRQRGDLFY